MGDQEAATSGAARLAERPSTLRVVLGAIPGIGPLIAPEPPAPLRARLIGAIPLAALALIGGAIYAGMHRSESSGPSIVIRSNGPAAAARPPTRHAGQSFVDSLLGADAARSFGGGLLLGRSPTGAWQGALDADGYVLTGTRPANASVWHITPSFSDNGTPLPVASIEADVFITSDNDDGGAGLELARSKTGSYLLVVNRTGTVMMTTYTFRTDGSEARGGSTLTARGAKMNDWNHIQIRRHDGAVEFLVNGDVVGSLSDPSIDGLDAGLFATGSGTFRFRNLVRTLG